MSPQAIQPPHLVIRASAGSGKTYQLTGRAIGLLARGIAPDALLATTFTRKAAGEILDRVLTRLAAAAKGDGECARLARDIDLADLRPAQCAELLAELVRRLHRLQFSTLDSFFARLAGSFALELGLPPGWRIVDEASEEQLTNDAIRAVVSDGEPDKLCTLLRLLTKGEAVRSVSEQVRDVVTNLYELYQETEPDAWNRLTAPAKLRDDELERHIEALEQVPLPDNKNWTKAHAKDLEHARAEKWPAFISVGIAKKVAEGAESYYRKRIETEVYDAYTPLIEHAKGELVGRLADQTRATYELLERFDREYTRIKHARRALRFGDVTRALAGASLVERLDEIFYRLDETIAHLLLDEFQDTSLLQWQVLEPLARHLVNEQKPGRTFFCVGDVKQAIYGWRGGVAEIFDALDEKLTGLASQPLDKSWRSSQPIIDAVNDVFSRLEQNPALDNYGGAPAAWAGEFRHHTTAKEHLPGYARLVAAPEPGEGDDAESVRLRFAADEIQRLAGEAPGHSIGVLVRKNKTVARLIYELRQRGVSASEEGGNPLTDSPAVALVMSLITLADHPGDRVAAFHVAHSPLGPAAGVDAGLDPKHVSRAASRVRRRLLEDGYGPTIFAWARELADHTDARDLTRLMQLVGLAHQYDDSATLRTSDFVNFVTTQAVQSPSAAQVRVMTVHQAKGLEFHIGVLPDLDQGLLGQSPTVVTGRRSPTEPVSAVCRYASAELRTLLPENFQKIFDENRARRLRESLCLLYVALTRPVHALHLIVDAKPKEKNLPATFAGVIRGSLAGGAKPDGGAVLYETGDPKWFEHADKGDLPEREPEAAAAVGPKPKLARPPKRRTRNLPFESPSGLAGNRKVDLRKELLGSGAGRDYGNRIHACFAAVEWLDDPPLWGGRPDEDFLRAALRAAGLPATDLAGLADAFARSLEHDAVRALLTRDRYLQSRGWPADTPLEVWRERPFIVRRDRDVLRGTLDRAVVAGDGAGPRSADIIDYKTDAADASTIQGLVEHYRPQLEAYRQALAELTSLPVKSITIRLAFVSLGEVVEV